MIFRYLTVLFSGIFLLSCNDDAGHEQKEPAIEAVFNLPAPGTIVAEATTPVKDGLNNFDFKVAIAANEFTSRGTYTIRISYGPNVDSSMFTLPKGAAKLPVFIKKGDEFSYIIGFTYRGEDYDYYEVSFQPGYPPSTSVRNIKAWVLQ